MAAEDTPRIQGSGVIEHEKSKRDYFKKQQDGMR